MQIVANGIRLEFEEFGPSDGAALILINGQADQLINWPRNLISGLAESGLRVIVFDNRDAGLSQKFPSRCGDYSIEDMAGDVLGLLDALEIECAHMIGSSMGGLILSAVISTAPNRVLSATFLMAGVRPSRIVQSVLEAAPCDQEQFIEKRMAYNAEHGGSLYSKDENEARETALSLFQRHYDPDADNRHLSVASRYVVPMDRLQAYTQPVLLIAGTEDRIVQPDAVRELASAFPSRKTILVPGMGHSLSVSWAMEFTPEIVLHIEASVRQ